MRNQSKDSLFKKQAKRKQKYDLNQRKDTLKYKEALSQMRNYGRQKR